jgi:hypothetical protein
VGEWTDTHTNLAMKIIEAIEEGKVSYDNDTVRTMWEFSIGQLS